MQQLLFEIKNLSAKQGNFEIKNINLELQRGDILGIMGRSGSGKSTFIKSLIGQVKITGGRLSLKSDQEEKNILNFLGYSPQENSLYSFLTLDENIQTFGELYNIPRDVIDKRMQELLHRLDLQADRKKRITQMSGGMKKRADLAITLIHDPEIIILDEPFNGLDIALQKFIWDFLVELSKMGKIILISSHNLRDLIQRCNKFCIIEQGNFYDTMQIKNYLKTNKEKSLEDFLQRLFHSGLKNNQNPSAQNTVAQNPLNNPSVQNIVTNQSTPNQPNKNTAN